MVNALLVLIVIIAAGYGCFWFIEKGIPADIAWVAKIIVAILGILAIVKYVLPGLGINL